MAGEQKLVAAIIRRLTTHEVNLTMAGSPNVKRVGVWHFVVTTFGGTYYGRANTIFNTTHQSSNCNSEKSRPKA